MNVVLWLDKRGQGPKVRLSPSKVLVMAKKRQSSVGSSLRAWSPDPTQLSSLKKSGAQSAGSQAPQATQSGRLGPADCEPADCHCRDQNGGEVHCYPKAWAEASGWPWWGLWCPAGHSPKPVLWGPQFTCRPKAGWPEGPGREGQDTPLTSFSTSRPPLHCCLNPLTNCGFLTVGCLWPLLHCPVAEQDPLPGNRVQRNDAQQRPLCWRLSSLCSVTLQYTSLLLLGVIKWGDHGKHFWWTLRYGSCLKQGLN